MLSIPLLVGDDEMDLLIILEEDNLKRIKMFDPATIEVHKFEPPFDKRKIRGIQISSLTSPEVREFKSYMNKDVREGIAWLSHNFKFRPELGDNDRTYEKAN